MKRNIRVIILAAGEGKRLRPYTSDRPKCLVELSGKPLLAHQIKTLESLGLRDLTIVTGYCADKIKALGYSTVHNPDYDKTNMVASLMCAKDHLDGTSDVLICYSDIVYEPKIIQSLLECQDGLCTSIDKQWSSLWRERFSEPLEEAETLKLGQNLEILELGKKPQSFKDIEGQYMGLIKVKADCACELVKMYDRLNPQALYDGKDRLNMFMTSFLQSWIDSGKVLRAVLVSGGWLEVDSVKDLEIYHKLAQRGKLSAFYQIQQ